VICFRRGRLHSPRTIERCIKGDPRIIKNKKYYSIDEWARLETRYLNPKRFGLYVWNDVVLSKSESYTYDRVTMRQMVETFGAIVLFAFIEASRQFQDNLKGVKDKKYYKERNDLVLNWAMNSVLSTSCLGLLPAYLITKRHRKAITGYCETKWYGSGRNGRVANKGVSGYARKKLS
jgi:hypothetical protein